MDEDILKTMERLRDREPDIESRERLKEFAVLVPVVRRESGPVLLFEVRSATVRRQPNVICFPGGAPEEGDWNGNGSGNGDGKVSRNNNGYSDRDGNGDGEKNGDTCFRNTAIRECCEELGTTPEDIEIVAPLDMFVSPFSFIVHSYLGYLDADRANDLVPNPAEVAKVLEVPLDYFMETPPLWSEVEIVHTQPPDFPVHLVQEGYRWERGRYKVPFFSWEGKTIWGLTARLVVNLVRLLKEASGE